MPLAFSSLSHGRIAFGFFNIQSDMLLCDRLFFFASRFCQAVEALAYEASLGAKVCETDIDGWHIALPEHVGDLHGAIAGTDLGGFLGAVYQRYPFPKRTEDFKQSPEGSSSQAVVETMISPLGQATRVSLRSDPVRGVVALGPYTFSATGFAALLGYVEQGGYPRYRDERQPAYVRTMMAAVHRHGWPVP